MISQQDDHVGIIVGALEVRKPDVFYFRKVAGEGLNMRLNDQDRAVDLPGDRSGNVDGRALPEIINVRLVSET